MITYAIPSGRPKLPPIGGPGHAMDVRPSAPSPPRTAAATVSLLAASNLAVGMFLGFNQSARRRWMVGRSGSCSLSPHGRTDNSVTLSFSLVQQSHIPHDTNGRSTLTTYRVTWQNCSSWPCPSLAQFMLRALAFSHKTQTFCALMD